MRIAVLGGGPAGLYFAISTKLRQPDTEIIVFERNKPDDTFGWGVVLSDETLDNLEKNDPTSAQDIRGHFAYWDDISVHHQGQKMLSTGHGFCGIGRKKLLLILQNRAHALGVDLRFETNIESADDYAKEYDIVVAADGRHSSPRIKQAMIDGLLASGRDVIHIDVAFPLDGDPSIDSVQLLIQSKRSF